MVVALMVRWFLVDDGDEAPCGDWVEDMYHR
jgi:hypothetical protein